MKTGKDKISIRQLFFIFTIMVSSPATRLLPKYTAAKADQAGWLAPIVCIVPLIAVILIVDSLLKKYKGQSMSDIILILFGRYLGILLLMMYLLWSIWLTVLYSRYYVERLTSSIYPNINMNVLLILTFIPIAYMLRSGFTVIARMGEILLPFIGAMLFLLSLFLVPLVRTDNVLPIYFNDIMPIIKASAAPMTVISYLFPLFFLSDKIVNLKSLRKFGYIATFVNISSLVLVIFISIGVLGSSVAQRTPMPVLSTVKQISLMDTIENIESIIVAIWIFADFTLISTLFVVSLSIVKSLFKLSDTKLLINTFMILIYFLTLGISSSKFELEHFSATLMTPINITFGFAFPIVFYLLSKLRKGNKQNKKNEETEQPSSTE